MSAGFKICTACKTEKPWGDFTCFKDSGKPRSSRCKKCHAAAEYTRRKGLPKRSPGSCADCGGSLVGRGPQAQFCSPCARKRRQLRHAGDAATPLDKRKNLSSVLALVRSGLSVAEACREADVSSTTVARRQASDVEFGRAIEDALTEGSRVRLKPCGTHAKFARGCRCPRCIQASREYTRDLSRKNRAKWKTRRETATPLSLVVPHGLTGYLNYGCRCDDCKREARMAGSRWQRHTNAKSLERATRHNSQWTGPEIELAARSDLSASQVASMIGRTLWAVQTMRNRLRREPSQQWLAGKRGKLH